jgi:muramoyltetrapeptide carboxypeptidase
MNRKYFLQTLVPAGVASIVMPQWAIAVPEVINTPNQPLNTPPFLQIGDVVGITCPASPVEISKIQGCLKVLNQWGLNAKVGSTVGKQWQRFGGTDEERWSDFQQMLDDAAIKAILFGKGGYGTMRIMDKLNWNKFKQQPKWLIGFSDLTTVHLHAHAQLNVPTLHAAMAQNLTDNVKDLSSTTLHDALFGHRIEYTIAGHELNREGFAVGVLVGGNLSMIQANAGSISDIQTDEKILFIEDVSEYKYTVDRMLMNLKRSGKLNNLAALVVGAFSGTKKDVEETFTQTIEEIIMDKVVGYNYPVCFGFPSGHIKNNHALKLGVAYDLNISKQSVSIFEKWPSNMPLPTVPKLIEQDTLPKSSTIENW